VPDLCGPNAILVAERASEYRRVYVKHDLLQLTNFLLGFINISLSDVKMECYFANTCTSSLIFLLFVTLCCSIDSLFFCIFSGICTIAHCSTESVGDIQIIVDYT